MPGPKAFLTTSKRNKRISRIAMTDVSDGVRHFTVQSQHHTPLLASVRIGRIQSGQAQIALQMA